MSWTFFKIFWKLLNEKSNFQNVSIVIFEGYRVKKLKTQ